MKRIVQCPKCQAKLAVFDMGKPINQKCPKCSETFVIESEQSKKTDDAKTPPPKADAQPEVKTEKASEPKVEAKTELPVETKAEAKPEVKAEAKADSKADVKPEVKAEAKTEVKADAKSEAKAEVKADTKADAKTDAKTDVKTDSKPEAKTETKTESKPEAKAESKTDAKTDAKAETAPDAKTDAKATGANKDSSAKKTGLKAAAALAKSSTVSESSTPPAPEHNFACGISFFDVMIIIGLLIFSLVLQVIGIRKDASRFNYLDQQVQSIQSQLNALKR